MCIFGGGKIESVSATSIFTTDLGYGTHAIVYQMDVRTRDEVAMILPVPVLKGTGEDALQFIDLKSYKNFFKDMRSLFPERVTRSRSKLLSYGGPAAKSLKVHKVGDYIASYVPSMKEFKRLDKQFRLPHSLWRSLPSYKGFGFAVFQIRGDHLEDTKIHPMAFKFPAANLGELFFPTVHVHDLAVPTEADYDHSLYYQRGRGFGSAGWEQSAVRPIDGMSYEDCQGLVRTLDPIERLELKGDFPNADYILVRPKEEDGDLTVENRGVRKAA